MSKQLDKMLQNDLSAVKYTLTTDSKQGAGSDDAAKPNDNTKQVTPVKAPTAKRTDLFTTVTEKLKMSPLEAFRRVFSPQSSVSSASKTQNVPMEPLVEECMDDLALKRHDSFIYNVDNSNSGTSSKVQLSEYHALPFLGEHVSETYEWQQKQKRQTAVGRTRAQSLQGVASHSQSVAPWVLSSSTTTATAAQTANIIKISKTPAMIRMPPIASYRELGDTLETIPMFAWLMPYIVASAPTELVNVLTDLPSLLYDSSLPSGRHSSVFTPQSPQTPRVKLAKSLASCPTISTAALTQTQAQTQTQGTAVTTANEFKQQEVFSSGSVTVLSVDTSKVISNTDTDVSTNSITASSYEQFETIDSTSPNSGLTTPTRTHPSHQLHPAHDNYTEVTNTNINTTADSSTSNHPGGVAESKSIFPPTWKSLGLMWLSKDPTWRPWEVKTVYLLDNYLYEATADGTTIIGYVQLCGATIVRQYYRTSKRVSATNALKPKLGRLSRGSSDADVNPLVTSPEPELLLPPTLSTVLMITCYTTSQVSVCPTATFYLTTRSHCLSDGTVVNNEVELSVIEAALHAASVLSVHDLYNFEVNEEKSVTEQKQKQQQKQQQDEEQNEGGRVVGRGRFTEVRLARRTTGEEQQQQQQDTSGRYMTPLEPLSPELSRKNHNISNSNNTENSDSIPGPLPGTPSTTTVINNIRSSSRIKKRKQTTTTSEKSLLEEWDLTVSAREAAARRLQRRQLRRENKRGVRTRTRSGSNGSLSSISGSQLGGFIPHTHSLMTEETEEERLAKLHSLLAESSIYSISDLVEPDQIQTTVSDDNDETDNNNEDDENSCDDGDNSDDNSNDDDCDYDDDDQSNSNSDNDHDEYDDDEDDDDSETSSTRDSDQEMDNQQHRQHLSHGMSSDSSRASERVADTTPTCAVKLISKELFWSRVTSGQERSDALVREVLAQSLLSRFHSIISQQAAKNDPRRPSQVKSENKNNNTNTIVKSTSNVNVSIEQQLLTDRHHTTLSVALTRNTSNQTQQFNSANRTAFSTALKSPSRKLVRAATVAFPPVLSASNNPLPLVEIHHIFETIDGFAIELELMHSHDLFDHLSREGPMTELQVSYISAQLIDAISMCNRLGIAHRDVKLSNVTFPRYDSEFIVNDPDGTYAASVYGTHGQSENRAKSPFQQRPSSQGRNRGISTPSLSSDSNSSNNSSNSDTSTTSLNPFTAPTKLLRVKLADFGMSGFQGSDKKLRGRCGTPGYVAPDILCAEKDGSYSLNVDMFSLGVATYTLLAGYEPFYGVDTADLMQCNREVRYAFHSPEWDDISEDCKDFISRCLSRSSETRLTPEQAKRHPFIRGSAKVVEAYEKERSERGKGEGRMGEGINGMIAGSGAYGGTDRGSGGDSGGAEVVVNSVESTTSVGGDSSVGSGSGESCIMS